MEGVLQPFLDEPLLDPIHRRGTHADVVRDRLVFGPGICGQKNLRSLDYANRALAATDQQLQLLSFVRTQGDAVAYVHGNLGSNGADLLRPRCLEQHLHARNPSMSLHGMSVAAASILQS